MSIAGALYFLVAAIAAPCLLVLRRVKFSLNFQALTPDGGDGVRHFQSSHVPPSPVRPCQPPYGNLPHCDSTLSKGERIKLLINILTPEEKISLLGHDSPEINRPGIYLPAYKWWNEGLHGAAWTDCCPPYQLVNVTVFPQVIGLAATWNRTLWNEVGGAIGSEAVWKIRSADEVSSGSDAYVRPGLTYFTPNINLFRDPRWGRGQETPGEDPYLTSHYAAIMVMSLQYGKEYTEQFMNGRPGPEAAAAGVSGCCDGIWRPRVAATCKHFAAYSLETKRLNFSAEIHDERDWNDTYLPAFDACIHAEQFLGDFYGPSEPITPALIGGAIGVMCSYNSINGIPACADPGLLQRKLREKWGFQGYVVSDCWAIANLHEKHEYAESYQEAAGMAISSGVDLDCGDTVQGYGKAALDHGHMKMSQVNNALTNLFGVLVDLGYFNSQIGGDFNVQAHRHDELALEAALQSIVLLKNGAEDTAKEAPLPLTMRNHKKVNLVGPLANDDESLLGNYHGIPSNVLNPLKGLQDLGIQVNYVSGCNVTDPPNEENHDFSEESLCNEMSSDGDATVLVMGLNQSIETEGLDRTSLLLPKIQQDTIEHATRCSKARSQTTPVILVVISGGPIDLSYFKTDDRIDAILYTGYPGQAGGKALAHILYGRWNPSARLTTALYHESYVNQVPLEDMRMRPDDSSAIEDAYPGRSYRFYNGTVVYPFGYGLSYSTWEYSIRLGGMIKSFEGGRNVVSRIEVSLSNSGPLDGSDSVLLFHEGPDAGKAGNPIKTLIGFETVSVPTGSTQNIVFNVEKWMRNQSYGYHTFSVGPSMDYRLQVNTMTTQ